jgi:hypothetical protein
MKARQLRPLPPSKLRSPAVQPPQLPSERFEAKMSRELPECKTGGSTAVCGKPHVRWCGRGGGRNPITSTRSPE